MVIHSTIYVENKQTLEYNVDYTLKTPPPPPPPPKKKKKKKKTFGYFLRVQFFPVIQRVMCGIWQQTNTTLRMRYIVLLLQISGYTLSARANSQLCSIPFNNLSQYGGTDISDQHQGELLEQYNKFSFPTGCNLTISKFRGILYKARQL